MGFKKMHSQPAKPYITKVDKIIFRKGTPEFEEIDHLCFLSKNLYNATLYCIRQYYFKTHTFLKYAEVNKLFVFEEDPDYYALPAKVSHAVQMQADSNFRSWFGSLKSSKTSNKKVKMPDYLPKDGRMVAHYEKGAISKKELKKQIIHLSQTALYVPTRVDNSRHRFSISMRCK